MLTIGSGNYIVRMGRFLYCNRQVIFVNKTPFQPLKKLLELYSLCSSHKMTMTYRLTDIYRL